MTTHRAPKQWCLTRSETVTSFESWRQNLLYTLSLDSAFAPFLDEKCTWGKKTKASPLRGFADDPDDTPADQKRTAAQKVAQLELMLGQVANFCPIISRHAFVRNSTSMSDIWQTIRTHYGFQSTGGHFLDFADIKLEPDERPEDLYQRLMAFIEDNLLTKSGGISHHGDAVAEDEDLSPTLENVVVLTWLRLLHPDLPRLVKQRYGTELRSRTLASIKPEISQAMGSLLDELQHADEAKVMRTAPPATTFQFNRSASSRPRHTNRPKFQSTKTCPLCKQAGRRDTGHYLSACPFLPDQDKRFITKARLVATIQDDIDFATEDEPPLDELHLDDTEAAPVNRRVQVRRSPFMHAFHGSHPVSITIDSGAEVNMIRESVARSIGATINKSSQQALQADGRSPLTVKGETRICLSRQKKFFTLEALVVEDMDVDVLAGVPFMSLNDVSVRPAKHQVLFSDGTSFHYGAPPNHSGPHVVRRTQAFVVRSPAQATTIWPGEFVEVDIPSELPVVDDILALEPRCDTHLLTSDISRRQWPTPCITASVAGKIRIPNTSDGPISLRKHEHFCQVRHVSTVRESVASAASAGTPHTPVVRVEAAAQRTQDIRVDPDSILPSSFREDLNRLHDEYSNVFSSKFSGYNGSCGPYEAVVNMGPVQPPQRKGRIPQYARDRLVELQQKFDDLEGLGVFKRPEDVGVVAEYLNPSFLVKKPSGSFRLVTAFAEVGRYAKPQPSLMPDVDTTLRTIAKWKYIVATDLTNAFYQIPLSKESMKYCGVVTPFKGVRVYTRCAMGMPGSETALEELMCRVLGDLLQEGSVAKLADDLYCGGNSPAELLTNWRSVLEALRRSGLCIAPSKTVVCPKSTTILGWIWSDGRISASPHRIATLSSCTRPENVRALRSFIGAYKVLARVIPGCSKLLSCLDEAVAGRESAEKVMWSDDLLQAFQQAQEGIKSAKTITLPRPSDQLWIVTDGAVKDHGLGATLYVTRDGKLSLAGFFSAKLRKRQLTWIPCEIEALGIASAIKHFSPYIVQSDHTTHVLTDSKPCAQAYERLCRGEFSASARVSTFLATASRYHVSIQHLAGTANLPSDFASRNAPACDHQLCQVCTFIAQTEDSVVRHVSVQGILSGSAKLPFTTRSTWLSIQEECQDLRRTRAHLNQGTRPSKKATDVKDVKRYLHVASISSDKLLVVPHTEPLIATRDRIIVPRQVLSGLLTALHVKLVHPSSHQLKLVVSRFFYALDLDRAIDQTTTSCHHCASLRSVPRALLEQSSCDPPESIGISFAADVLKRERQLIFILRECVTSFTSACFVESERRDPLREAIIELCVPLRPLDGPFAVVRTDPASALSALVHDPSLQAHRIHVELGRAKNDNKNPVGERAVQEVEQELLRSDPTGGPTTRHQLALTIARLNSRIRGQGLSSRELMTQRDQFTCSQLPIEDGEVIRKQHQARTTNHEYSERSKAPNASPQPAPSITVGSIIYLINDKDKTRGRPRYIVVSVDGLWCNIRKFTGAQLRNNTYRVRITDCYVVPAETSASTQPPVTNLDTVARQDPPLQDSGHPDLGLHSSPIPARVQPAPPVAPDILTAPLPVVDHLRTEPSDHDTGPPIARPPAAPGERAPPAMSPPRPPGTPTSYEPASPRTPAKVPTMCLDETPMPPSPAEANPDASEGRTSRSGRQVNLPSWLRRDYVM